MSVSTSLPRDADSWQKCWRCPRGRLAGLREATAYLDLRRLPRRSSGARKSAPVSTAPQYCACTVEQPASDIPVSNRLPPPSRPCSGKSVYFRKLANYARKCPKCCCEGVSRVFEAVSRVGTATLVRREREGETPGQALKITGVAHS
jgi:hypothetical protein